ncbi:MAG: polyphosphate kinase 2 family protein, partial [Pseudomonadaceae bacterium]
MSRLPDAVLDDCLCNPAAPLAGDPARQYGLDKAQAQAQLLTLKGWLRERLTMLWANRHAALLLVLQGPDCAGKNGVIRRVLSGLDPLALAASSFQAPNAEERAHGFLWRYRRRLPAPGTLAIFDRSYYEALVSDLRDGLCETADLAPRQAAIRALEEELPSLHISPLKCY